jgi:hypothetical protein
MHDGIALAKFELRRLEAGKGLRAIKRHEVVLGFEIVSSEPVPAAVAIE